MPYKLLLADDSVTIQRVIELTFADEDVQVTAVGDGQQAIDRILSDRPDIVLADVGMPKQDGYEVAAFIKNDPSLEHIPVLLLTGAFEPVDDGRARAVRCDGVLAKPFEPHLLISRVRELLSGAARLPAAEPGGAEIQPAAERPAAAADASSVTETDEDATGRLDTPPTPPADGGQFEFEEFSVRPEPPAAPDSTLDDYFDRLDAAFAHLTGGQPGRDVPATRPAAADPWTAAAYAAPVWPALAGAPSESMDISPADALEPPRGPGVFGAGHEAGGPSRAAAVEAAGSLTPVPVPDAFASLLEAEREHGPDVVHRGRPDAATVLLPGTAVTQAFVDDVARRVLERLGEPAFRGVVAEIVSATAERLVREEIARIKSSLE